MSAIRDGSWLRMACSSAAALRTGIQPQLALRGPSRSWWRVGSASASRDAGLVLRQRQQRPASLAQRRLVDQRVGVTQHLGVVPGPELGLEAQLLLERPGVPPRAGATRCTLVPVVEVLQGPAPPEATGLRDHVCSALRSPTASSSVLGRPCARTGGRRCRPTAPPGGTRDRRRSRSSRRRAAGADRSVATLGILVADAGGVSPHRASTSSSAETTRPARTASAARTTRSRRPSRSVEPSTATGPRTATPTLRMYPRRRDRQWPRYLGDTGPEGW